MSGEQVLSVLLEFIPRNKKRSNGRAKLPRIRVRNFTFMAVTDEFASVVHSGKTLILRKGSLG